MSCIRGDASDHSVNRSLGRGRGKAAGGGVSPECSRASPHHYRSRARFASHTPAPIARTHGRHPALKQMERVSILQRWRGGRAANCTGLENRRVFTHVGSNPTPSARERRSRRRGCYSNPGLRLRCFASSPRLRTRCAGPRLRIPPRSSLRPTAGQPGPTAGQPVVRTRGWGSGASHPRFAFGPDVRFLRERVGG